MGELRRIKSDPEALPAGLRHSMSAEGEQQRLALFRQVEEAELAVARLLERAGWRADELWLRHCARQAMGVVWAAGTEHDLANYLHHAGEEAGVTEQPSEADLLSLADQIRRVAARIDVA